MRRPSTNAKEDTTMIAQAEQIEVMGYAIQYDKSGVGHCWVAATDDTCHAGIREEIAAEIIDGGNENRKSYTATNGCKYRW